MSTLKDVSIKKIKDFLVYSPYFKYRKEIVFAQLEKVFNSFSVYFALPAEESLGIMGDHYLSTFSFDESLTTCSVDGSLVSDNETHVMLSTIHGYITKAALDDRAIELPVVKELKVLIDKEKINLILIINNKILSTLDYRHGEEIVLDVGEYFQMSL